MSVQYRVINNENVRAIPNVIGKEQDTRPIKGYAVCPELYANIFICARKKSGKTTIIWHLLKNCVTKDTTVIIFGSTVNKDKSYLNIKTLLKSRGIPCVMYDSMKDEEIDRLEALVTKLKKEAEEREQENESEDEEDDYYDDYGGALFKESDLDDDSDDDVPKKRKSKYQSPEYIIVYDDLSDELKSPFLIKLLKENRHYLIKNIISSQYPLDLAPQSRKQIDLWILPKGQTEDKLEKIYSSCQCNIDFETFIRYYNIATKDGKKNKHNFFFFMPELCEYRRNFNVELK